MVIDEIESKLVAALHKQLGDLGADLGRWAPLAKDIGQQVGMLAEKAIFGDDITEEREILEAALLNLESAAEAMTVRGVKELANEIIEEVFQTALKAALGAIV